MQTFISSDFWSDQIAAAFNAWAILIALILLCWTALKIKLAITNKQLRTFQAYTETVESRLQLARELNSGESNRLAELRAEIDGLRQLINAKSEAENEDKGVQSADIASKGQPNSVQAALEEVDASAATLAMANSARDHILTAEKLAIGDIEKKHKLRLVPRPSNGRKKSSR